LRAMDERCDDSNGTVAVHETARSPPRLNLQGFRCKIGIFAYKTCKEVNIVVNPKQFGPYSVIRKLGRGMTDVYLAFDTSANRHVVLKIVEESADSLTQVITEAERRGAALQKQLHEFDSRVIEIYDYVDLAACF